MLATMICSSTGGGAGGGGAGGGGVVVVVVVVVEVVVIVGGGGETEEQQTFDYESISKSLTRERIRVTSKQSYQSQAYAHTQAGNFK